MSELEHRTHVLEEIRSIRTVNVELMSKMTDVCGSVRELIIELRHAQKASETQSAKLSKLEDTVRDLQMESATNKPIMDIAKRMYWSQWATIVAAVGGTAGVNWTKFFGG